MKFRKFVPMKSMSKEATVAKHIDDFLKGRTPEAQEEFRSRTIERQYACIIQWRRKLRKKQETPRNVEEIVETLEKSMQLIVNAPAITEEQCTQIRTMLERICGSLDEYMSRQKQRTIENLEARRAEIEAQLRQLREG